MTPPQPPSPQQALVAAVADLLATLGEQLIGVSHATRALIEGGAPHSPDPRPAAAASDSEPWVTKAEIAKHLGVTPRTVNRYMQLGMPYSRRFENSPPRFRISEVDAWMQSRAPR
jgi:hypothetical protein